MKPHLIVIGGGAAGFFCAVNAARLNPSLQVTIIEKTSKLLSKVKVSGGGRCNVTHNCFDIEELSTKYPRGKNFLKKALHWFNPQDTIDWFAKRNVVLKVEDDGRMFPTTNSSQTIVDCLLQEAEKYRINIITSTEVERIEVLNNQFNLFTTHKKQFSANYLCIACGGYPKSLQFNWLTQIGHTIQTPIPSLFTFNMPQNPITQLMGVSIPSALVKLQGSKLYTQGPVLITHWGLSGPAILKLSAFAARELHEHKYQFTILINWIPNFTEAILRDEWPRLRQQYAAQKISTKNPFGLPQRFWQYLLQLSEIGEQLNWSDLPVKQQNKLIQLLTNQSFTISGKTTFKEEFVTCGGIKLSEIEVNTMESKLQANVFFAGEVIDVDGITGGFNFQNAWTTGFIAAKAIAAKAN